MTGDLCFYLVPAHDAAACVEAGKWLGDECGDVYENGPYVKVVRGTQMRGNYSEECHK